MSVTEVLNEIGKLARPERARVIERIDQLNAAEDGEQTDDEKRREMHRQMLAEGLIKNIPSRQARPPELRDFKPLKIAGKPVSETIIEERG